MPVGPHGDCVWHQGAWKRPRADGRLMAVDESGTFLRRREGRREFARPHHITKEYWDTLSHAEQRQCVLEAQAASRPGSSHDAAPALGATAVRGYSVTFRGDVPYDFPPPEGPPPRAVVRRIVFDEWLRDYVEDSITAGWTKDDWQRTDDELSEYTVTFVYDPAIAGQRRAPSWCL